MLMAIAPPPIGKPICGSLLHEGGSDGWNGIRKTVLRAGRAHEKATSVATTTQNFDANAKARAKAKADS